MEGDRGCALAARGRREGVRGAGMTRTCVGCRTAAEASELVRLVLGPDRTVVADPRGGSVGRGAWVHPTADCLTRAVPKGVAHTLRTNVKTTADELVAQ